MMKGSDIGIQEKKAKLLNEWERFTSTDGESIESYYHHFLKLMNDLKRNKHFLEKIAIDYSQLYDFLKYNQKEVDDLKAKRLARTQDPLALMATSNNTYTYSVLHQDQPSFNQNYMQQPIPNPEDITDPTTAMNMSLGLMAKAFKLNYSTTTQNNQRISSNPRTNQNLNENGNLVAARAEGNATWHNSNKIRCYNCRGVGHFTSNCTIRPRRRDVAYLQTQLLIAQKEEAGIQLQAKEFDLMAAAADLDEIEEVNANCILMANLQQASTSGTQTDKAPVYDSDGSAEVHNYENCYENEIFNMFTQEEQYTELLEPILEPHHVPHNDNNIIYVVTSMEQSGGTVEQHPANSKETSVLYDSLYHNLAIEVEKVNTVNRKLRETNAELTIELARFKNQEKCFVISQEKYDKLERCYQKSVYQEHCLSKKINALHLSFDNTKNKRPQPRSNTKNDRVLYVSKSSCSKNKEVDVEEHHRKLLLSRNKKHRSSECNNVKLATQNVKSKVICAMYKQCLISVNHDVCLLNYVKGMTSRGKKQKANVSIQENKKKQKPKVKKPKKVGSIERLASPKPSKPRSFLRWSQTRRLFDLKGKIIASSESESQSDCSKGDNACISNPLDPTIKRFPNSTFSLAGNPNMLMFLGTARFRNDHIAAILGFGDLQWGNILITRVAFRRNACFVRNLEGVDLLSGNRTTNLYTINLHEMASASPICVMARASSTKSWLWHQSLSHLNFNTINDLAKNNIVTGLPKFKYHKEHLCSSCEQGKSKRASHPPKPVPNSRQSLHLLHMDLCGPMRIASINGKRALCYPKNDRGDIGKLGAKGDIGFFIGYSVDSCAFKVYNRRTKKIMETMNVIFDDFQLGILNKAVQTQASKHDF
nr:hypothetical protein [Tanacetum cinerariifolium]